MAAELEISDTIQDLTYIENGFGNYLKNILPDDIAISAGAFSFAMRQINGIESIPIEKFAQIVLNLETTKDLNLPISSIPTDINLVNDSLSEIGTGSGPDNTYTMSDFFGTMSGLPYNVQPLENLLNTVSTTNLNNIYDNIITLLNGIGPYDVLLQNLINQANSEINSISNSSVNNLNEIWDDISYHLYIEQKSRDLFNIENDIGSYNPSSPQTQKNFIESFSEWALNTQPHMHSQTLEAISNWDTTGGRSIVALMREIRNQNRLSEIGIELDNTIPNTYDTTFNNRLEKELLATCSSFCNIQYDNTIISPKKLGYYDANTDNYMIFESSAEVPLDLGEPLLPGSLSDSPYKNIIPPSLNTFYTSCILSPSTYTPEEALNDVIQCNCECWVK